MALPFATKAMHQMHILYAQLSVAIAPIMHHSYFIKEFLIVPAILQTPSSLGCRQTSQPATPLTLLVLARQYGQKIIKSRSVFARTGFFLLGYFLICMSLIAPPANAGQLTIATATNFLPTLKDLQKPFSDEYGHTITIVTGSSGALAVQIINGAPYDVFLSADHNRPEQLVQKGFGEKKSMMTYAYGKLALWSSNKNLLKDGNGEKVLRTKEFPRIAIANPALAPYGLASIETLRSLGLYSDLSAKIIRGENIAQAFALLATGSAPLGFVAQAQLARPPWNTRGSFWLVPTSLHNPIRQNVLITKHSKNKVAAWQFIQFLKSQPAKKIIRSFAYETEN